MNVSLCAQRTSFMVNDVFPPVFLSTDEIKLRVSREVKRGRVRKIGPRLYTTDVTGDPAAIIRRNLWEVVGLLFPDTVVGYRTALEGKPSPEGTINVVGAYDRVVKLPGLTVRQIKGRGPLDGDTRFMGSLWLATRARAFLECLRPSRAAAAGARSLPREEIERRIERIIRVSGEREANALRDEARVVAPALGAERELRMLDDIIGTILGSRSGSLSPPASLARRMGSTSRSKSVRASLASTSSWSQLRRATALRTDDASVQVARAAW